MMDLGNNSNNANVTLVKLNLEGFDDDASKEGIAVESSFTSADNSLVMPPTMSDLATVGLQQTPDVDAVAPAEKKKGGWPKGKKRKKMRDSNAPKPALNGYLHFLNERREILRRENPTMAFAEMIRVLGAEWTKLPQHEKQRFLDEAEKDKERYNREMEAYQKTEAYKLFKSQKEKKMREMEAQGSSLELMGERDEDEKGAFDIPIFTEEFLDHNKGREGELRQLRKQTTELEEQNAILSKHIESMKHAIEKLDIEAVQQRSTNIALQGHLDNLRTTLTDSFHSIRLPGTNEVPTLDTIDNYMTKLHNLILDSPQEHEGLIAMVRDIIGRLNIDGDKL
ncbi:high mobility group protein 20A-like isoform X1 [Ostrea edulis]|uniref:high mobility group protein 20A-like isoform X1 n=1 Tax=Ostrea edulis TaxID=37623 RepID=UPI0020953792|nr:high mobility group protein 20A-like isoform X1 [Ostrea edulis]XP_048751068.1 high mobility group protein 20A-like isoform X1 [Ostrea edulis]